MQVIQNYIHAVFYFLTFGLVGS